MATATWDVLGGNPAPGDVAAIEGIVGGARAVITEVATDIDEMRRIMSAIGQATWHGPAAERFLELLGAAASHLVLMERAHAPVSQALSAHAALLAEQQQQAARTLAKAVAAVTQRAEQMARRTAAEERYAATAGDYDRASNELENIEREISTAGMHLVSNVVGIADSTLQVLLGSKQSWEKVRSLAIEGMAAARDVVSDAERLIDEAEEALAAAVRMAGSIAAEVESSVASACRVMSEMDDDLGTIWRHVEQGAVGGFDHWASSVRSQLTAVTPSLGEAFHVAIEGGRGFVDGTIGIVAGAAVFEKAMWEISPERLMIDPSGWMHSVEDAGTDFVADGKAIEHHPGEFFKNFGKRLLNWTTWAHDPAKAFGELLPSAVLAVATVGSSAGATAAVSTVGDMDNAVGFAQAADGSTTSVGETAAATYVYGKVKPAINNGPASSGPDDDLDAVDTPDVTVTDTPDLAFD